MRISNSKANTYRRCPKRYQYKYVMGLRPKRRALPLERGSWLHALLETHYTGGDWEAVHEEKTKEFNNLFDEEREELGDLPKECKRIMRAYLRRYKVEDKFYTPVDAEIDELIELPGGDHFNFIIDLVVEDRQGYLWLWDHKTVSKFMEGDYMLLDAQLARYFWSATVMGYTPLAGVMFNELRTKAPAIPQELKNGGVSKRANIDTDYHTYLRAVKRAGEDPDDYADILNRLKTQPERFFRRTTMPKDKALTRRTMTDLMDTLAEIKDAELNERFPRTVNKTCTWDCDFKDVCITEYFGADPTSLIKANFTTKDEMVVDGDS